jgi:hypothetical protein
MSWKVVVLEIALIAAIVISIILGKWEECNQWIIIIWLLIPVSLIPVVECIFVFLKGLIELKKMKQEVRTKIFYETKMLRIGNSIKKDIALDNMQKQIQKMQKEIDDLKQ